jgi:uncharacterized protein YndB with AHSA1/START domain
MSTPPVMVRVAMPLPAPPEQVFDAFLDPARIGEWMFGARLRDEEVLRISVDPRVGGRFSFLVRRGTMEIDHVGTYREIERPRRLAFTWGVAGESSDESVVTIEIVATAAGSQATLTHEMEAKWAEYAERVEGSWKKMLGVLRDVLAERSR